MAGSRKISLMWLARTPQGWRYFPALFERQHGVNLPRHGWVKEQGTEIVYPQGRYVLRSYVDGRKVYSPVESCHPRDAMYALQRAQRASNAEGAARNPLLIIQSAKDAYVRDLEKRNVHEMAEKARHILGEFAKFCEGHKFRVIHTRSITRQHILDFHAELRRLGKTDRTVADKHQRIKAWLRFCGVDTSFMPPVPKFEQALPTVYEPSEVKAIREAAATAGDVYMLLMVDMALKLGLREQELTYAEWDDIDQHHLTFRVQGKVRKDWRFAVKDKEQRDVPVPVDLLQALNAWHETRPGTLLILGNGEDQPEGHLLRKLKALVRNAGLNCGRCEGCARKGSLAECEEWTLHKFRRTYLTTLLRSGIDPSTVQHLAGHSDFESTMRYLRPAAAKDMQGRINAIAWQ